MGLKHRLSLVDVDLNAILALNCTRGLDCHLDLLGFRVLGFRDLGFRVLGVWGLGV